MTRYVIDASSVGPVLLRDESMNAIAEVARGLARGECVVPAHWRFEVANMLLVAERNGRMAPRTVDESLVDLDKMSVRVDADSLGAASGATFALARRHRLTIYDAAYCELAKRLALILVTLDRRLAIAARAEGVETIAP